MPSLEMMQNLFPNCPICKSTKGYEPSIFYPLVACKSCKSEWNVYDYGMELKLTSEAGLAKELLNKKYSFDFWKGEPKPQITGRIFAPMDCVGGTPEQVEPSKGYIVLKSENIMLYVGQDKNQCKLEIEIPIHRLKEAVIKDKTALSLAIAAFSPVLLMPLFADAVKNVLMIGYRDSVGVEQRRIFYFYDDEKSTKELIHLLGYLKQKVPLELEVKPIKHQIIEQGKTKFFCRYCGAENRDDAKFCEKCGKNLE